MSRIENKLPTHQNEFSEEFIKKCFRSGLVHNILRATSHGVSPYNIIEMLVESYEKALDALIEIRHGAVPPIVFQVTSAEFEELKNRINGEGN